MKSLLSVLFLFFFSVVSFAEMVSSVSFNPSRMGEYTYLKVAEKASLRGGLNATTLNISSGGTVAVTPDNSSRVYEVPTVSGEPGSAIDMPATAFHGNTAELYTDYTSETSGAPAGLLSTVKAQGGDMKFMQDSYINTLYAIDRLRQKVGTLKGGTVEISGNSGSAVNLYESDTTKGFFLAGNDIPEPVGAHTNTGVNLEKCTLAWEKRKTSTSPSQEVWVLSLQGCNSGGISPGDPIEPVEPTYAWVLTDPGLSLNSGDALCYATCASTGLGGAASWQDLSPELHAGSMIPECSQSTVNRTCHPGGPTVVGGRKYCPTYTCQALY